MEMLRRVDLQAVLKSDVTISLYRERPLPRPIASLPRKKGSNTCYINVGSLQPGDAWVSGGKIKSLKQFVSLPFIHLQTTLSSDGIQTAAMKSLKRRKTICSPNIAEESKLIR